MRRSFQLVLLLLSLGLLSLSACGGKKANEFLLEGQIRNYPSQRLLLESLDGDDIHFIDSTYTDEQGHFSVRGHDLKDTLVQLRTMKNRVLLLLPANKHLVIDGNHDSLISANIQGDPINEQLGAFRKKQFEIFREYERRYAIMRNFDREKNLAAWRKAESGTDTSLIAYKDYLRTFIDTVQYPILKGVAALSYSGMEDFYRMEKMSQVLEKELPGHIIPKTLRARAQKELKRFFAIETPNFRSYSASGDSIDLADTRGKVVIFYAWASYCEFSRRENKALRAFFEKNKHPDLVLVDYSFDDDKAAWLQALAEDSLPSAHHLLSPNGWSNHAVRDLAITSLPFTYLVDARGILRSANLRAKDLEEDADSLVARYRLQ
jgi:thiol-disulfide isomerase/thioredoxin